MNEPSEQAASSRLRLPLLVLAVGVGVTAWFLLGFSPAPPVPADNLHRGLREGAACMDCHASDGAVPQPAGHTNRLNCYSCHRVP